MPVGKIRQDKKVNHPTLSQKTREGWGTQLVSLFSPFLVLWFPLRLRGLCVYLLAILIESLA